MNETVSFRSAPESTWHAQLSVSGNYAMKTTSSSSGSPECRPPNPGTMINGSRVAWALELSLTSLQASHFCPTPSCPRWDGFLSTAIYVDGQMFAEACEAVCSVCAPVAFCSGGIKLLEHFSLGISVWGPRTPGNPGSARSSLFQLYFCVRLDFPHIVQQNNALTTDRMQMQTWGSGCLRFRH